MSDDPGKPLAWRSLFHTHKNQSSGQLMLSETHKRFQDSTTTFGPSYLGASAEYIIGVYHSDKMLCLYPLADWIFTLKCALEREASKQRSIDESPTSLRAVT